ncbi:methyltransferase RsmF C-terminal domain-like protein [Lunatimonas salinarum]|uniref:methyltransferase RsmF C-terminal domain-like protein n=1 Tax=Lunatimonas salinarum TaxID=1774590 RepID=UPI001AE0A5C7|nr:RsmB/NOP family class I SAM-dependent RNA methyltransferase [Lunatimonas salinarum]
METDSPLPKSFVQSLEDVLEPNEIPSFLASLQEEPVTSVRLNPFKPLAGFEETLPVPWCPEASLLRSRPSFTLDPLFHAGAYYVQEASSTFLSHVLSALSVPKDAVFLDLCAAPGGKSTLLASYLGKQGILVANEVISSRAQVLKENIVKWGIGNTVVTQNDASHFEPLKGLFDLVLVDAPCSGEGMFRKDPNAIAEWSPDHVTHCAVRQRRILDEVGALPKAGGYLVYATCTYNSRENEENIRFLAEEFSFEPVQIPVPAEWGIVESHIKTDAGDFFGYRFFPHMVAGEGFFISVMKRASTATIATPKMQKEFRHPHLKRINGKLLADELAKQVPSVEESSFYALGGAYFLFPKEFQPTFEFIANHLNLRYMGIALGEMNHNSWIPSHEWALSILPKHRVSKVDVSLDQALSFLRKETFPLEQAPSGWVLVTYLGHALGWVKNLGSRINNYYPKEWRIRMD